MNTVLVVAPTAEPFTIPEVKVRLDIIEPSLDEAIGDWIIAAREAAETICRRALVTQQWRMVLDEFPSPSMNVSSANWYGPQWGTNPGPLSAARVEGRTGYEIFLPHPPLATVNSVTYYDQDGALQTLSSSLYLVDNISEPARLVPAPNTAWPATQARINAVSILFTCGYGNAAAVPQGIKSWMLMRIGAMYENREEIVVDKRVAAVELPFVDRLLDRFRVVTF